MATYPKFYFLAPTRNYVPDKRIKLGNIIPGPKVPDEPYNESPFTIKEDEIDNHNEYGWSATDTKSDNVKVGIWTGFLQSILGVTANASIGSGQDSSLNLNCESVLTREFTPKRSFLDQCIKDPGVQNLYRGPRRLKKPIDLYMIIGLKIANGASSAVDFAKEKSIHLHAGADGSPAGAPGSAGVDFDTNRSSNQGEAFKNADNFVLGFRLKRIRIGPKGILKVDNFSDGATFGQGQVAGEEDIEVGIKEVADGDARGTDFRFD
ncbi:hypothetical protein AOQ84DRAFT_275413, partial [Glonium stellatum]